MRSVGLPEHDLLILSARETMRAADLAKAGQIARRCQNPAYFGRNCLSHKVLPLAYTFLVAAKAQNESEFLTHACDALRSQMLAQWIPFRAKLRTVQNDLRHALDAAGHAYAFYRGISFAERYYSDDSLRLCEDIDILIREDSRAEVEMALLDSGFCYYQRDEERRDAKANYAAQLEFVHSEHPVVVDVSWRLVANAAIGPVSVDMNRVWGEAKCVRGNEYMLAPEDELLEHLRHLGQGHDFERGLVRTCADATAVLRKTKDQFRWSYFEEQARRGEARRVVSFFAEFYDRYYRDSEMPELLDVIPFARSAAHSSERRVFVRVVHLPLLRLRTRRSQPAIDVFCRCLRFFARFWALDRFTRLLILLQKAFWPSNEELLLLTYEKSIAPAAKRRMYYYVAVFWLAIPLVFLGCGIRFAFGLPRLANNVRCRLFRNR